MVVLGLLTNHTIVGYYSGADKLINCVKLGVAAINDAVYPYISRLMKESQVKAFSFYENSYLFIQGSVLLEGFDFIRLSGGGSVPFGEYIYSFYSTAADYGFCTFSSGSEQCIGV